MEDIYDQDPPKDQLNSCSVRSQSNAQNTSRYILPGILCFAHRHTHQFATHKGKGCYWSISDENFGHGLPITITDLGCQIPQKLGLPKGQKSSGIAVGDVRVERSGVCMCVRGWYSVRPPFQNRNPSLRLAERLIERFTCHALDRLQGQWR